MRDWGIQAMIGMIVILMIALVIVAILASTKLSGIFKIAENDPTGETTNVESKTEKKSYSELEDEVIDSLKKYQKKYYTDTLDGEKIGVKVATMQSSNMLDDLIDKNGHKCTGYGIFINNDDKITYSAYIKCSDDYTTKGYSSEYE